MRCIGLAIAETRHQFLGKGFPALVPAWQSSRVLGIDRINRGILYSQDDVLLAGQERTSSRVWRYLLGSAEDYSG